MKEAEQIIIAMLDEADAKFQDNIRQAQEWLASHPKT